MVDCGKKGHARRGCECDRCVRVRTRERESTARWVSANRERKNEWQRATRAASGNAETKRYEKTPKGYLMRSYRNMQSRVEGIQKAGSWGGKELLPRDEFYEWALSSDRFEELFAAYEESGYDRKLAPSPDRIDPDRGYTLDNMRWLTHSENSGRANRGRVSI